MRLLLEDFAHYATRKPRRGEDATLVFDEFSAIAGGREAAIQLVERPGRRLRPLPVRPVRGRPGG